MYKGNKLKNSSLSHQMLQDGACLEITRIDNISIREWLDEARIGHEGTARLLSTKLGVKINVDRRPIILKVGDEVQVTQPISNRIEPGTELEEPELAYFLITVKAPHKCKTLAQYWNDELEVELNRRKHKSV